MTYFIFIRGIPENQQVKDVRVHVAPGVNTEAPFRVVLDTQATCIEVRPDPDNGAFQGQTYRWFHLKFNDGRDGWVRDDLLDLQGDCSAFGYGNYSARMFAFTAGTAVILTPQPPVTVPTTPTAPVQPTQPATTPIPVTFGSTSPTIPTAPVTTGCDATVRRDARVKIRSAPSVNSAQVGLVNPGGAVRISAVAQGQDGQPFRWMRVTANGVNGYIREDLLVYSDDCIAQGLSSNGSQPATPATPTPPTDLNSQILFASPIRQPYTIFQEYGVNRHKGVDLSVKVGTPVVASGFGVVAFTMTCKKCTDDKPNFISQGIPIWDPQAINDPAWGYGFGNYVVVRYGWTDLPSTMREAIAVQRLAGGNAYVIHAHLSQINIASGAIVRDGTALGLSGNTGNSTGPHLHVEVRVSLSPTETTIFNRLVVNPHLMYQF
jgi:Peptidase family M23/Bacterial SH3 domain